MMLKSYVVQSLETRGWLDWSECATEGEAREVMQEARRDYDNGMFRIVTRTETVIAEGRSRIWTSDGARISAVQHKANIDKRDLEIKGVPTPSAQPWVRQMPDIPPGVDASDMAWLEEGLR